MLAECSKGGSVENKLWNWGCCTPEKRQNSCVIKHWFGPYELWIQCSPLSVFLCDWLGYIFPLTPFSLLLWPVEEKMIRE